MRVWNWKPQLKGIGFLFISRKLFSIDRGIPKGNGFTDSAIDNLFGNHLFACAIYILLLFLSVWCARERERELDGVTNICTVTAKNHTKTNPEIKVNGTARGSSFNYLLLCR